MEIYYFTAAHYKILLSPQRSSSGLCTVTKIQGHFKRVLALPKKYIRVSNFSK